MNTQIGDRDILLNQISSCFSEFGKQPAAFRINLEQQDSPWDFINFEFKRKTENKDTKTPVKPQPSLLLVRQQARRPHGEPAKSKTVKDWRKERPSIELELKLRTLSQNSPEWYKARERSSGASGKAAILGWSAYKSNVEQYLEDTGQVAECERISKDCFPADHGHYYEDEARLIATEFLGCKIEETGLWIHPKYCWSHASPDGLSDFSQKRVSQLITICLLDADKNLKGLIEIKCTIFGPVITKGGVPMYGFPHWIKPEHVIQMQDQASCLQRDYVDYVNFWRANEQRGFQPMPFGPFDYCHDVKQGVFRAFADKERKATPGHWKVAELYVTRMYASTAFQDWLYEATAKHIALCEDTNKNGPPDRRLPWEARLEGTEYKGPKRTDKQESPTFQFRPLIHVVYYLTGSPMHLKQASEVWDATDITIHMNSKKSRPRDWLGDWPPRLLHEARYFDKQKPVTTTLSKLYTMGHTKGA